MDLEERTSAAVVTAAQSGDERARDQLAGQYLPLVYNLVGRALGGHPDVDDVVQETMLRAFDGIEALRDPSRFRSWLVTIAMRQINDRWRARQSGPVPLSAFGPRHEVPDPAGDFADLTIMRLGLSGERREVVAAAAWLDPDDRRLLSLWWLETAGELTRAELAAALRLSPAHAAVRVQRMKNQLTAARGVVRALARSPRCDQLAEVLESWDGRPSGLWRKRIVRHSRHCASCRALTARLTPAEALLAAIGMLPPPTALAGPHLTVTLAAPVASQASALAAAKAIGATGSGLGRLARALKLSAAKPFAAAAVGLVAVGGAGAAYLMYPVPGPHPIVSQPTPAPSLDATATPRASASPGGPPPTGAAPSAGASTQAETARSSVYGSVVDAPDSAPPKLRRPGPLPQRPAGSPISATGRYELANGSGPYLLDHNGDYLMLRGQGYFRIRWQIITATHRIGRLAMPSWTGLAGKLFHVASGGSRRMDDVTSGSGSTASTGMGSPSTGFDTLPAGAQQMWQNEYYYLDGTVVLHQNQGFAEDNLIVQAVTWQQITADIDAAPGTPNQPWILRYGLVRDTGRDTAPVPQYATRTEPADPAQVPQRSEVG